MPSIAFLCTTALVFSSAMLPRVAPRCPVAKEGRGGYVSGSREVWGLKEQGGERDAPVDIQISPFCKRRLCA
eukprot:2788335-Pyramimonas_sp.AAC.1